MKRLLYLVLVLVLMVSWFLENQHYVQYKESLGYSNLEKARENFFNQYDSSETKVKIPNYRQKEEFNSWIRKYLVYKNFLNPKDTLKDILVSEAIKKFQNYHGLDPDGLVGPKTHAALKIPGKVLYRKMIINMERWKSDRIEDSCYILINIPSFTLSVINNNKVDLKFKVIVGLPNWKTPVLFSKVTSVIFNPYWYVPHSIAVKEVIHDIKNDHNYLTRNNFRVINYKNQAVDPRSIDWARVNAYNFNYTLRQDPGVGNALGVVKFIFPSPYSIYMHDTPSKQLFESDNRALSHGCIRLEKPMELLTYLYENKFLLTDMDSIQVLIQGYKNYRVTLNKTIPIYIGYYTCEADAQGNLFFYDDIYKKDENLIKMIFE